MIDPAPPAGGQPDPGLDVGVVSAALAAHGYLADEGLATAVFLALALRRPLLLEGEAGVGKTEVAKVLARWTGGELIRLQCYEGIDVAQAVYEWDYSRQLLHLRAAEATGAAGADPTRSRTSCTASGSWCGGRCCGPSPRAAVPSAPPVLLIDEIDRADDEFEAFLLEILADYQVTVPELGTFRAEVPPIVVITSNRTRDVHDALKRRCLYHWVEHPDFEREVAIVRHPGPRGDRARSPARWPAATEALRGLGLYKPPGVAETIDWAQALAALGRHDLDESTRPRSPSAPCSSTARTRSGPAVPAWGPLVDAARARASEAVGP